MGVTVSRDQRYTPTHRCPICGGCDRDPRGKGVRCTGYLSADGRWAHCSREEYAGSASGSNGSGTWAHALHGVCPSCGSEHGPDDRPSREPEATYDYCSESGQLLYQVVRLPGKQFRQRRPDPAGGWLWSLAGVDRVPYRLPELIAADPGDRVWVSEGEKDVETLRAHGLIATCNSGGAGKWQGSTAEIAARVLAGRDVVIIADRDDPGRAHAQQVAASLAGHARSVRVIETPTGKDVSEYLSGGGSIVDLADLAADPADPRPAAEVLAIEALAEHAAGASEAPIAEHPHFRLIEASAICAPLPPRDWLIPELAIGPGSPVGVFAYAWGGKTIAMQDMLLSVATGSKVWGRFRCRQGRAVHIDHEQGEVETRDRYQRLMRARGLTREQLDGQLALATLPNIYLTTPGAEDAYTEICTGAMTCFIDSLAAAQPGLEENATEFARGLIMLGRVSERTGCTIQVAGHTGKLDLSPDEKKKPDSRTSPRGSSAILAACSTAFTLAGGKGQPKRVRQIKGRSLGVPAVEDFFLAFRAVQIVDYYNKEVPEDPGGFAVEYQCAEQLAEEQRRALVQARPDLIQAILGAVRAKATAGESGRGIDRYIRDTAKLTFDAATARVIVASLVTDRQLVSATKGRATYPRYYMPECAPAPTEGGTP